MEKNKKLTKKSSSQFLAYLFATTTNGDNNSIKCTILRKILKTPYQCRRNEIKTDGYKI